MFVMAAVTSVNGFFNKRLQHHSYAVHEAPDVRPSAVLRLCESAARLRDYDGPTCFAIPGNHDYIDGLETFQRHILHKGWLGGWCAPLYVNPGDHTRDPHL